MSHNDSRDKPQKPKTARPTHALDSPVVRTPSQRFLASSGCRRAGEGAAESARRSGGHLMMRRQHHLIARRGFPSLCPRRNCPQSGLKTGRCCPGCLLLLPWPLVRLSRVGFLPVPRFCAPLRAGSTARTARTARAHRLRSWRRLTSRRGLSVTLSSSCVGLIDCLLGWGGCANWLGSRFFSVSCLVLS